MNKKDFAVFLEHFHRECLEGLAPQTTVEEVMQAKYFPPGAAKDLMDFIAGRVTMGDVRAWMIEAGAALPGTFEGTTKKKPASGQAHGVGTKDAFLVLQVGGSLFHQGIYMQYAAAKKACDSVGAPSRIERYTIPLNTAGDYCEECVDLVMKAHEGKDFVKTHHED